MDLKHCSRESQRMNIEGIARGIPVDRAGRQWNDRSMHMQWWPVIGHSWVEIISGCSEVSPITTLIVITMERSMSGCHGIVHLLSGFHTAG
jgi:hypothetical protein